MCAVLLLKATRRRASHLKLSSIRTWNSKYLLITSSSYLQLQSNPIHHTVAYVYVNIALSTYVEYTYTWKFKYTLIDIFIHQNGSIKRKKKKYTHILIASSSYLKF